MEQAWWWSPITPGSSGASLGAKAMKRWPVAQPAGAALSFKMFYKLHFYHWGMTSHMSNTYFVKINGTR